tara:strand:+ start:7732 stop:8454 length:723 start_codon:yes stop_codon:yes gene_type:complete
MISKIKKVILDNKIKQRNILYQVRENHWADVYHDSIKGISFLQTLPLNIGRWAGGYPFFYVLNRVLKDFRPKSILEMGLGESTKFVSLYLDNYLTNTNHNVLEQDEKWVAFFNENFQLSEKSKIVLSPLTTKTIDNFKVNSYKDLSVVENEVYNLYLIDGPFGSDNISRYEIVELSKKFKIGDEFIIIMDDYNRIGEQKTINKLLDVLNSKGITFYSNVYSGLKSVFILGTEKYKHVRSL